MIKNLKYKEETVKTVIDEKEYTIINLTPIYTDERRKKLKRNWKQIIWSI